MQTTLARGSRIVNNFLSLLYFIVHKVQLKHKKLDICWPLRYSFCELWQTMKECRGSSQDHMDLRCENSTITIV